MFDAIAGRYDLLNHVLSGGQDLYWRWRAVRRLRLTGTEQVLDLCTGTCDVARTMVRRRLARRVLGIDFSAEMLKVGQRKLRGEGRAGVIPLVRGDAMRLPAASGSMDAVTIAFGIRNVQDAVGRARGSGPGAEARGPAGHSGVLDAAAAAGPGGVPLVLPQRPAAARAASCRGTARPTRTFLPRSRASRRPAQFVAQLEAAGLTQLRGRPFDVWRRLSLRCPAGSVGGRHSSPGPLY